MLVIGEQFSTGFNTVGLGYDSVRDEIIAYGGGRNIVNRFTRAGANVATFASPGETADDYDIDFVDFPFTMAGIDIPVGSAILINGESGTVDLRAVDPVTGFVIATLATQFGASHVVGGSYHAERGTFFVVQDRAASGGVANRVAEIDLATGTVRNSFSVALAGFDVSYGDLDVEPISGDLFIVSSARTSVLRITAEGELIGTLPLPGVGGLSGIAFLPDLPGQALVTSTGGLVSRLSGFLGDMPVLGTSENDVLVGTVAGETLAGRDGDDQINGGVGNDMAYGNAGNDRIAGGDGIDRLVGQAGDDHLFGDRGDDRLIGGSGNDRLNGGFDNDRMEGGIGDDVYVVDTQSDIVVERADQGIDTIESAIDLTLADAVENLVLTGAARFGTGNAAANRLDGGARADILVGLDGNDQLFGAAGTDRLEGGAGDDHLDGGTGGDRLTGGAGDDTYILDSTLDRAVELAGDGYDTVETALAHRMANNIEALTLTGTAAVAGVGNTLDNTITANEAANALSGGAGNDTLNGGGGNDSLNGGLGADALSGGLGDDMYTIDSALDTITEAAGEGYDSVSATVDHTLGANIERLVLTGAARRGTGNALDNALIGSAVADTLDGGDGNDTIQAGTGNDTVLGGVGNDIIDGGGGRDRITGGAGADRFVFRAGETGTTIGVADIITDFARAQGDRISVALTDAIAGTPVDDRFAFIGTAAFGGVAGQLRYEISGNVTYIHGDTNGDAVSDLVIRLDGVVPLIAADFQL